LLRKFIPAVAALAIALTGGAYAVADDYVFEPFRAEIKASIIHRNATKKPIVNAVIIHTRMAVEAKCPLTRVNRLLLLQCGNAYF
jgi:hypothetical protein